MNVRQAKTIEAHVGKEWSANAGRAFSEFFQNVAPALRQQVVEGTTIYPSESQIFKAFLKCPYDKTRVVILGMDPYHNGQAIGLSFDSVRDKPPARSLARILKKIEQETGSKVWEENKVSYLQHLPGQGVLMLNTALTVVAGQPGSHLELWATFTQLVLDALQNKDNLVWILWGGPAKKYKRFIVNPTHKIVEGAHPSPLAQNRFFENDYFTVANSYLSKPITF